MENSAGRLLGFLWLLTAGTFFLHEQGAVPLLDVLGESKAPMAVANLLAAGAVVAFPASRLALATAAALSALALLAWHSWLGAYQPLVPWGFLFLLALLGRPAGERWRALLIAFAAGIAVNGAHRLNGTYLAGFEFAEGGTLYRDLPAWLLHADGTIIGGAAAWAVAWLASGLLPLPWLGRGGRAWLLFLPGVVLSLVLYKVLFYGMFLAVPAAMAADPAYLRAWRGRAFPLVPPWAVFVAGMLLFFGWFLGGRQPIALWIAAVGLCTGACAGASPCRLPGVATLRGGAKAWLAAWMVFLLLGFGFSAIPAPFALTHFSAREARFPPAETVGNWKGIHRCDELRRLYALRWGYKAWPSGGDCRLLLY